MIGTSYLLLYEEPYISLWPGDIYTHMGACTGTLIVGIAACQAIGWVVCSLSCRSCRFTLAVPNVLAAALGRVSASCQVVLGVGPPSFHMSSIPQASG